MRSIKFFIAVMLAAINMATANATVTITAPVKPNGIATELKAGESYSLFNVGNMKYVNRYASNSSNTGWSDIPYAFRLDESTDGYYVLWQGSRYLGGYNVVSWNYSTDKADSSVRLDITKNDNDSYKIRMVSPNYLWGYYNSNSYKSYVYSGYDVNTTGENVSWIFVKDTEVDVNEVCRYYYKNKLYKAIVNADAKGYHVERYEDVYNDDAKTNEELNALANELNAGLSDTHSYLFPDWSDYPILITSIGDWSRNGNNNYLWKETYNKGVGTKNTLKASVYVDQPSTLSFILDCSRRWVNEATMPFQVFVDGELVYDYNGETNSYNYDSYFRYVLHGTYGNSYSPYGSNYHYNSDSHSYNRHFVNLQPGHHLIDIVTTQKYNENNWFYTYFREIGVEKTPTIEVNLAKAGSLGDEVLRAMDNNPMITETNIRNTRRLKISGKMGDADFEELYNMTQLYSLDLTDAEITEIKKGQLSQYYHNSLSFLHDLKLPKTLKTIGQEAFYVTYIDNVDIPETVTTIGDYAFSGTRLRQAYIPNATHIGHNAFRGCTMLNKVVMKNVDWMGINTFAECYNLKDVEFEGTLTTVPQSAFHQDDEIVNITIPETVTKIEGYAFHQNNKSLLNKLPDGLQVIEDYGLCGNKNATFSLPEGLKTIGVRGLQAVEKLSGGIPSTVTSIGGWGMEWAWLVSCEDTVRIPAQSTFGESVFQYALMKNVVFPENINNITNVNMFGHCDSLKSIKFMSSTLVKVPSDFVNGLTKKNIKIIVPDYLRTTYMRDSYWMDFTIETFPTTEMDSVVIRKDLEMSQHDRFEGTPSLTTEANTKFTILGTSGMELNNVMLKNDLKNDTYSQLWTSTDNIHINGDVSESFYTEANKWYFISLPFDCVLSRTKSGAQYAVRYYDGAARAEQAYPLLIDDGETEVSLYNVDAQVYIVGGNEYGTRGSVSPTNNSRFKIINNGDGTWTLKNYINGSWRSMFTSGDDVWLDNNNGANANTWVITHTGNGIYEITNKGIEDAKLGWNLGSNNTRLYINNSVNATRWAFVPTSKIVNINWKDYNVSTGVIPAGTGFILMTSKDAWTEFYSADNGKKQTIFFAADNENNEQHFALKKHESTQSADRGWNLVGNPYPNYYSNHKISFSAPITLWTGITYQAYSLRDDDVALKPCQAFFVQCPEDVAEISFPAAGRQLTSVITDQANARPMDAARQLLDLSLIGDKGSDKTRIVMNDNSSADYELACDAAKFMSMESNVPQLYSLDASATKYSINERPYAEEGVILGAYFPVEGEYTLAVTRSNADKVMLLDNVTGEMVNITDDEYVFHAEAGTNENRFVVMFDKDATSVESVNAQGNASSAERIFTPEGIEVKKMMPNKTYIVCGKNGVRKVLCK